MEQFNTTSLLDFKKIDSPADCRVLTAAAVLLFLIFFMGSYFNFNALAKIMRINNNRPINNIFSFIYFINFLGCVLEIPIVLINCISCGYSFSTTHPNMILELNGNFCLKVCIRKDWMLSYRIHNVLYWLH
jgi:hypothetical protein